MKLITCSKCGQPFTPRRTGVGTCGECTPAPKTDERSLARYRKLKAIVLAGDPDCHWCGEAKATTADHVVPVARGGRTTIDNLVPACDPCNKKRGGQLKRRGREKNETPHRQSGAEQKKRVPGENLRLI